MLELAEYRRAAPALSNRLAYPPRPAQTPSAVAAPHRPAPPASVPRSADPPPSHPLAARPPPSPSRGPLPLHIARLRQHHHHELRPVRRFRRASRLASRPPPRAPPAPSPTRRSRAPRVPPSAGSARSPVPINPNPTNPILFAVFNPFLHNAAAGPHLIHMNAAANIDRLPGDVVRVRRSQEAHQVSHVLRLFLSPQRNRLHYRRSSSTLLQPHRR